jgi:hypothetical protein
VGRSRKAPAMDVMVCTAALRCAVRPIQRSASCCTCVEIAPVGTPVTDDVGHLFSRKEAELYV